jgi:ketosteroid isomerase-like protein
VEAWHDILEIRAVLDRYAAGVDRRDWELVAKCFTDDVHADYGRSGTFTSRAPFVECLDEMHRPMGTTLHRITNHDIAVDGDTGSATSYFDAVLHIEHKGFQLLHVIGVYRDELRRDPNGWRISARSIETVMFRREHD